MNHIYRVVGNAATLTWSAVAETARGRGKRSRTRGQVRRALAAGLGVVAPALALAQVPSVVPVPGGQANAYVSGNGATVVNINAANAAGLSHNRYQQFNVNPAGLVLNNTTTQQQISYQSQLAGQVMANFNMVSPAGVILNEVVSNNRSTLAGFTEVLGGRADVVLANPYGITCTGCGFINTDRVTLTTGAPTFGANGALAGFDVGGGDILVTGNGLNASAQQVLDLVTRSVRLEGTVHAQDLGITTGANHWDYGTRTVTGSADSQGAAPTYAIDSSALGGMYANRIRLSATEGGVGVRLLGDAAASGADFTLTAAGRIEVGAQISAARDVQVASASHGAAALALIDGSLTAGRNAAVAADQGGLHLVRGAIVAGHDLSVTSASLAAGEGARLQAGRTLDVTAHAGDLALGAAAVLAGGDMRLAALGRMSIAAGTGQGVQSTGGRIAIDAAQGLVNEGIVTADHGDVALRVGGRIDNGGKIHAGASLDMADAAGGAGQALVNRGELLADGAITLRSATLDNHGWLQAGTDQTVETASLRNAGQIIATTGSATLHVNDTLDNSGSIRAAQDIAMAGRGAGTLQSLVNRGDVLAGGALTLQAASMTNTADGWIQAATGSTVQAGHLDNAGTWLLSQRAGAADHVDVDAEIVNTGVMQSGGDLALSAGTLDNRHALVAAGDLSATTGHGLHNAADAVVQAGGALSLASGAALDNAADGTLRGASVSLHAAQGLSNDGVITAAAGNTTLRADGSIVNTGKIHAAATLDMAGHSGGAGTTLDNSGTLIADGRLALAASVVRNRASGWIQAADGSRVDAASLDNAGTWLLSTQGGGAASDVQVAGTLTNQGTLQAQHDANLTAERLDNQALAQLRSAGSLQIQLGAAHGLSNAGTLQAGTGQQGGTATLGIQAAGSHVDNTGLLLGDRLAVAVGSLTNAGTIQGGGSAASSVAATGQIVNTAGAVLTMATTGMGGGTLSAQGIENHGTLQSLGALTLAVGSDGLRSPADGTEGHGDILADGDLRLQARDGQGYTATIGGLLQAGGELAVAGSGASGLVLDGNASGGTVAIDIGNVTIGAQAALAAQGDLALQAAKLALGAQGTGASAQTGRILAALGGAGTGTIDISQAFTNHGLLFSGHDLEVTAPSIVNAGTGGIAALNDLRLAADAGQLDLAAASTPSGAGGLDNQGSLYAGSTLSARANGILQNRGTLNAGAKIDLLAHTVINNTEINSDGDIRIVAASLRNEVEGGDRRVQTSTESSAQGYKDGDEYNDGGKGGNKNFAQNYRKSWTETFGFAPGTAPTVTPQITAGRNVQLVFHDGKNLGGLIYAANAIDLQGFSADAGVTDPQALAAIGLVDDRGNGFRIGGARFTNDSLATRSKTMTQRWTMHREEAGPLGGIQNFDWTLCTGKYHDPICDYDGYTTPTASNATSTPVPGISAGIYTASLSGSGFSLYNEGGTSPTALANAKTGNSTARGAVGEPDDEAGPAGGAVRPHADHAAGIGAVGFSGGSGADTLDGLSFLDSNAANGVRGTSFGGIDITLPGNPNGYFVTAREPGARYLVETNPLYQVGSATMGSDYLSKLLGYDPDELSMRLGDASYEAWLVRQQLIRQTGNAVLAGYQSADAQMRGLMENAAGDSEALGLTFGKALTPEQQAALPHDIVWMVQTEIDGKMVLAPVVYLAQSTRESIAGGAVISADNAELNLTSLTNTGGTLIGSQSLVIASTGDISNLSGLIRGGDVSLTSTQGSIVNQTVSEGSGGDQFHTTVIGKTAGIESTGSLALDAKQDIRNIGATLDAGTDASLTAGGDVVFDTLEDKTTDFTSGEYKIDGGSGRTRTTSTTVEQVKSGLNVGGNLAIDAGRDITLAGTDARVGGDAGLKAGGDLNIVARENSTTTHTESEARGFGMNNSLYGTSTTTTDSLSVRNVGSTLDVGGNAAFSAGNDVTVQGSDVRVAGDGTIDARNVNILAGRNYDESQTTTRTTGVLQVSSGSSGSASADASASAGSGRGLASAQAGAGAEARGQGAAGLAFSSTTTTQTDTTDLRHVGSNLSFGGDLSVNAANDVTLHGSTVSAGGDARVEAQNVRLLAAEDKSTSSTTTTTTTIGLMASTDNTAAARAAAGASAAGGKGTPGAGASASAEASAASENRLDLFQRSKTTEQTLDTMHQGSALSAGGNLDVQARDELLLQGSQLAAGGDMALAATDMRFEAVDDVHEVRTSSDVTTAGLYASGQAGASGSADASVGLGAQAGARGSVSASAEVGLYGSNTRSQSVDGATTAVTSGLSSGGNITRTASNSITDVGTRIEGGGDLTQSARTITSLAAADTTYSTSDSTTHTAKLGAYAEASAGASIEGAVGPGATQPQKKDSSRGAGIRASYTYENESEAAATSTAVASTIRMGGSVTSTSTGQTTLEGTQIEAGQDVSLAAGSLDYRAAQNTSSARADSTSAGGSVGVDLVNKEVSVGIGYKGGQQRERSSTAVVGSIQAGGNLSVTTTGDTRFEGTHLAADGAASVDAGGNLEFAAAKNTASASGRDISVEAGVTAGKSGGSGEAAVGYGQSSSSLNEDVAGSIRSGSGPLTLKSGGDAQFTGTQIAGGDDVSVEAGGNVAFDAARKVESSRSVGVDVSASASGGKKTVGGTQAPGATKKTGGQEMDTRSGAASLGVRHGSADSDTATSGGITSEGGSIRLASGGDTTLEGTSVQAAQGITIDTGGSFETRAARSTSNSTEIAVSASASGSSMTPAKKSVGGTGTTTSSPVQRKGSGVASVYVDTQKKSSSQTATLDGGTGGVVIHTGQVGAGAQQITARVPMPATMPPGKQPTAMTGDGKPLPAWLRFDPATGTLQGKPPPDFKGELEVRISVPQPDGSVTTMPIAFPGWK